VKNYSFSLLTVDGLEMSREKNLCDDQFELYDLTVVVEAIEGTCTCNMAVRER